MKFKRQRYTIYGGHVMPLMLLPAWNRNIQAAPEVTTSLGSLQLPEGQTTQLKESCNTVKQWWITRPSAHYEHPTTFQLAFWRVHKPFNLFVTALLAESLQARSKGTNYKAKLETNIPSSRPVSGCLCWLLLFEDVASMLGVCPADPNVSNECCRGKIHAYLFC